MLLLLGLVLAAPLAGAPALPGGTPPKQGGSFAHGPGAPARVGAPKAGGVPLADDFSGSEWQRPAVRQEAARTWRPLGSSPGPPKRTPAGVAAGGADSAGAVWQQPAAIHRKDASRAAVVPSVWRPLNQAPVHVLPGHPPAAAPAVLQGARLKWSDRATPVMGAPTQGSKMAASASAAERMAWLRDHKDAARAARRGGRLHGEAPGRLQPGRPHGGAPGAYPRSHPRWSDDAAPAHGAGGYGKGKRGQHMPDRQMDPDRAAANNPMARGRLRGDGAGRGQMGARRAPGALPAVPAAPSGQPAPPATSGAPAPSVGRASGLAKLDGSEGPPDQTLLLIALLVVAAVIGILACIWRELVP